MDKIKYEKITPFKISNMVDPAKCDLKQMICELTMLDFHPGRKRALPVSHCHEPKGS